MPAEITLDLETFITIVDGAILVAYRVVGRDWRFFLIDAEGIE